MGAIHRHDDPSSFVVVGGQSVVAWALKYQIEIPGPASETPLTADFDFQIPLADARWLAEQIGAAFYEAPLIDPTVNVATLVLLNHDKTKKLMVDVLKYVYGLPSKLNVKEWANELQFGDYPPVWVLTPLYVLRSRFANLYGLPSKRNRNGQSQAVVAMEIVRRYVMRQSPQQALAEVRELAKLAGDPEGIHCYFEYGMDPMQGLEEWFCQDEYSTTYLWPSLMRRVFRKRAVEQARRARANVAIRPADA